jgi:hypothetical protein
VAFKLGLLLTSIAFLGTLSAILIQSYRSLTQLCKSIDRAWLKIDIELKQNLIQSSLFTEYLKVLIPNDSLLSRYENILARYQETNYREQKVKIANEINLVLLGILQHHDPLGKMNSNLSKLAELQSLHSEELNQALKEYNCRLSLFPELFIAKIMKLRPIEAYQAIDLTAAQQSLTKSAA